MPTILGWMIFCSVAARNLTTPHALFPDQATCAANVAESMRLAAKLLQEQKVRQTRPGECWCAPVRPAQFDR